MPHAALFVVQVTISPEETRDIQGFNAARGFVCGASKFGISILIRKSVFQCRSRLCLWCKTGHASASVRSVIVSMPLAALFVVQGTMLRGTCIRSPVSMPLAALFVVQVFYFGICATLYIVSMPLAALFVVQARRSQPLYLLCPTALLESLRMFEMVVGKDAKHLFQYDFSLRRNSLCDQSLPCPRTNWKVPTMFCGFAAHPRDFPFRSLHHLYHSRDRTK